VKTDYCWRKNSKAILRKIILLKSKILLEWRNCLNSPRDKCHSCDAEAAARKILTMGRKPGCMCELITAGFDYGKMLSFFFNGDTSLWN
jgi:hypothetical protein